jgi:ubiquinone/menaquinone biosynthesis C-methylase UbiE
MSFFSWAAPVFGHLADRWSDETIERWCSWLRPHLSDGGGRVLDLGGGTGALAVRLADATGASFAVLDPTPEMLRYLKPHERVIGMVGVAEAMPFGDGEFDACLISDAFHHFRDQDGAVREIARVVRPGGALLVLEFDPRGWMRLIVWGEKLLGEPGAFFTPEEMCAYMSVRGLPGHCESTSATNYFFLGEVAGPESASRP